MTDGMSLTGLQADDILPKQAMLWVGGLRTYAQRVQFFLGVPNTLMIGVLFYNDAPALQNVFPSVFHWVGFLLGVVVPAAIVVDRAVLHPAQIIYNQHMNGRENRSPNFRETMENQRRIEELHEKFDELQAADVAPDGGERE